VIRLPTVALIICYSFSALGDAAKAPCVGTWRSQKGSVQFDEHHNFLVSCHDDVFGLLEMRGKWEELGQGVNLKPTQARGGNLGAMMLDDADLSFKAILHLAEDGSRLLNFDNETYQFVSAEAVVPEPWDVSPPPAPVDMTSAWIIRPPIYPYPRLDLDCKTNAANQIEMVFTKSKAITGVSGLAVWEEDANDYLWRVKMNGIPLDRLVYGNLPTNSPRHSVRQVQPQLPSSPRLPRHEKRFFVRVDVEYETLIPPSRGSDPMFFVFEFGKDGQIRRVRDIAPGAVKEPVAANEG
jgi:hypothetical protein